MLVVANVTFEDRVFIILQKKYHVPPTYMAQQPQVNSKMRAILIDWLIQVHHRFTLLQETLYLTVSIIDRFLAVSLNAVVTCSSNTAYGLPVCIHRHVQ